MNFATHCAERKIYDARLWSTNNKDLTQLKLTHEQAKAGIHIARSEYANNRLSDIHDTMHPTLQEEGILVTKDFLDTTRHAQAKEYITNQRGSLAKSSHTMLQDTALLHIFTHKLAEILGTSVSYPRFAHAMANNTYLQTVHNLPDDGDIQKDLHQDTFFHAFKWWYYAHAVSLQHGPTKYVKKSHILDKRKKDFMQREYLKYYDNKQTNPYSIEGSLRMSEEEAIELYGEVTAVIVPQNTLVVANVFGFHCRGDVSRESKRKAIHGSIRYTNPFE